MNEFKGLEERLNERLEYLYDKRNKYYDLNLRTRNRYDWRSSGIEEQIEALEHIKDGYKNDDWDECYEEDLRESME